MPSRPISTCLDERTLARLDAAARRAGVSRSRLAARLVEEGLRMAEHPGIVFRPSLDGPEPALVDGPYLWKIMPLISDAGVDAPGELEAAAESTNLTALQIRIALGYYAAYPDEIDGRIRRNEAEAERAYASWRRRQPVG